MSNLTHRHDNQSAKALGRVRGSPSRTLLETSCTSRDSGDGVLRGLRSDRGSRQPTMDRSVRSVGSCGCSHYSSTPPSASLPRRTSVSALSAPCGAIFLPQGASASPLRTLREGDSHGLHRHLRWRAAIEMGSPALTPRRLNRRCLTANLAPGWNLYSRGFSLSHSGVRLAPQPQPSSPTAARSWHPELVHQ